MAISFSRVLVFIFLLSIVTVQITFGQTYLAEVNGRPIKTGQYEHISGSPYLYEDWTKGAIKLTNGTIYNDMALKYDQVEDILLFKGKDGTALEVIEPITEFTLQLPGSGIAENKVFQSGFKAEKINDSKDSFYEVLADGKVKLLKRTAKVIREEKAYGSATINKNIMQNVNYYISKGETLIKIKKDKKSVLTSLQNKNSELESYLKANSLNLKEDTDLAKLIAYYNSL